MFELKNVSFSYKKQNVFSDINLNINKGDFVSIIWNSWAWKSTLLKLLTSELKPSSWEILIKLSNDNWDELEFDINKLYFSKKTKFKQSIWVVFQDYKLLEKKTVYENIAFALYVTWNLGKKSDLHKKIDLILSKVWLEDQKNSFISDISWWEAQRVSIARALVNDPQVIIADEPTWNLDPKQSISIIEILKQLNSEWKTIILSTHDDVIVNNLKKRVITIDSWKIISDENPGRYNL